MSTLVAGPWLGEFGWEVATWVPAIRAHAKKFDSVVVYCRGGHEHLYADFCDNFGPDNRQGRPDRWLLEGKKVHRRWAVLPDGIVVEPTEAVCMKWPRLYHRYGHRTNGGYDIVFHARAETKYGQAKHNWPLAKFEEVRGVFSGLRICSIGVGTMVVPGTDNCRGVSLGVLCDLLASAKVLLSPSSGPAHLASLCGCPHVVMTDDKYQKQIRATNRERYKKLWNPFRTPCKVLDKDNWQPSVYTVCKALEKFL